MREVGAEHVLMPLLIRSVVYVLAVGCSDGIVG